MMICRRCGAEVPDDKLVCDCFRVAADNEIEKRSLQAFAEGGPLYLQDAPTTDHHILPIAGNCITLCHKKRFQHPSLRKLYSEEVRTKGKDITAGKKPDWCWDCLKKALASLNAHGHETSQRAATPGQRKTQEVR